MLAQPKKVYILLLALLFNWCANGYAQAPFGGFTQYNIKDGLAGSVVHGICQDRDGFLWFATETGLSRFDGRHFKSYTTADGLPSNEVLGVMADSANRVWIQTFKNAAAYYYKGRIYHAANHLGLAKPHLTDMTRVFGLDAKGQIALSTNSNLLTLDLTGNLIKKDTLPTSNASTRYTIDSLVTEIRNGNTEFFRYNAHWMRHKASDKNHTIEVHSNQRGDWLIRSGDSLLIGQTKQPIYRMRLPRGFTELLTLNANMIALKLHTGGCLLLNINHPEQVQHCLPQEQINQVWADTEGNCWFSTNGSGVFKLGSLAVNNYQLLQQQLPRQVINISQWKGQMYIGTDDGRFWQMKPGSSTLQRLQKGLAPPGIGPTARSITPLLQQQRIFNPHQQLYRKTTFSNNFFHTHTVKTLSLAANGLLLATSGGVYGYRPNDATPMIDTVRLGRSTCALQVGSQYFIGTLDGLHILDSNKRAFFAGDTHPALRGRIGSLELSSTGTVWIASYSDGVIGWKNGQATAHITTAIGLSSNNCRSLFVNGNHLWVGTEKGLNKIDIAGNRPVVLEKYGTPDGLAADMINALYIDGATVYAGTSAGLSVFNEKELERQSICQLNITGIYISDKWVPIDTPLWQLPHADNDIRFEYAGISFRSEGRMRYRYRLLGLDTIWRPTTENTLSFPSLASGHYQLELQAINAYGLHSAILQRPFYIQPLLIEKTWFRIACLLLLGLLLWLLFHLRVTYLRKKERQQMAIGQRLAELEQMALRSQMNPHFIFNSLNAVYQYVMDKDLAGANRFITDFSQLIRLTFELSALPKITLAAEIEYLRTFLELEKVKYEGQFDYTFSIMAGLDTSAYFLPPLILQPYIENSIRHGVRSVAANGHITVVMLLGKDCLVCTIDDNGIGRETAQAAMRTNTGHTSRGMSLTAERLSIWGKQAGVPIHLEVTDKIGLDGSVLGTCVTLSIPIQEALNPY
jgi:anti-sigma regulatory factor (Ser/Thr protein kinase)